MYWGYRQKSMNNRIILNIDNNSSNKNFDMQGVICAKSRTGQPSFVFVKKKAFAFATTCLNWDTALACCVRPGSSCLQSSPPSPLQPLITTESKNLGVSDLHLFRVLSHRNIWVCSKMGDLLTSTLTYSLFRYFSIQAWCSLDADPYEVKPGARSFAQLPGSSFNTGYRCAESSWGPQVFGHITADSTGFWAVVNCSLCLRLFLDFLVISCLVHVWVQYS